MRLIRILLASILSAAFAGSSPAADFSKPFQVADDFLLLGVSGAGYASYTPPTITSNYLSAYGDSRTANSGGAGVNGTTQFTVNISWGAGYAGFLYPLSGNKFLAETGWNYGIGAQTSAGIAARATTNSIYCDDPTSAGAAGCFQGLYASTSAAGYAPNPSTATTIALTGFTGTISNGVTYYVQVSGSIETNCSIVANGSNLTTTSVTVPAGCINTAIGAFAQNISFTPAAQANPFWNYIVNGVATSNFGSGTDISANKGWGGAHFPATASLYSLGTDPAQVVALLAGTNDGNIGAAQTAYNLTSMLNNLGPTGPGNPNKIVLLADEMPRGLATGYSAYAASGALNATNTGINSSPEVHTIPASGPYTVTLDTPGVFYDLEQIFYAPCGANSSGTPSGVNHSTAGDYYNCPTAASVVTWSAGASDGVNLTNCATGLTGAISSGTYVAFPNNGGACTPSAAGQYSVSVTGASPNQTATITFNSADAGKKIAIYYRWVNQSGPWLVGVHDWITSSNCASSWTDSASGITFQNPGAKCSGKFPWAKVASTWEALIDTTTGANYFNLPYTLNDGLHPNPTGAALVANAMITAATAAGVVPSTAPYPTPSSPNWLFSGTTSTSTSTQTGTTCTSSTGSMLQDYFISSVSINGTSLSSMTSAAANAMLGASIIPNNTGTFASDPTIVCVDKTNAKFQLSAPATAFVALSNAIIQEDPLSIIGGGVISYAYDATTPAITGCGTYSSGYPNCPAPSISGWTVKPGIPALFQAPTPVAVDSGTQTAIANGTEGLSFGMASNPLGDGYDGFVIQYAGYAGGSGPTLSANMSNGSLALDPAGTQTRAVCRVLVGPGPNGHLTGFAGVQVKDYIYNSSTFSAPGLNGTGGQTFTTNTSTVGGGSIELNDAAVAAGAPGVVAVSGVPGGHMLQLDQMSPVTTNGAAFILHELVVTPLAVTGDPVSATVLIERCAIDVVTK